MSGPLVARLDLAPEPLSVRRARHFLRDVLARAAAERWRDAAELALSEVVTNVVLHAHTPMTVEVRVDADELRVQVHDRAAALPRQRQHGDVVPTGRGMELVAAVCSECGTLPMPDDGKVVWFALRDDAAPREPGARGEDRWDLAAEPDRGESRAAVLLAGLPVALWLSATEQHDAVLREYALWSADPPAGGSQQPLPPERPALADRARAWVSQALADAQEGPHVLDLRVPVGREAAEAFAALAEVLAAAERLAACGALLVGPAEPQQAALTAWVCATAAEQLRGAAPRRWAAPPTA